MSTTRLSFPWLATAVLVLAIVFCRPAGAETITITGTVLTPDGRPAPAARVFTDWVFLEPRFQRIAAETTTAEDGSFSLQIRAEGKPHSSGTVAAIKDGLGLGWSRVELDRRQPLEIKLNEEAPLAGLIRNQAGDGIHGATVSLWYVRGQDILDGVLLTGQVQATTDTGGAFALGDLPAGRRWSLMISATGYATIQSPSEAVDDAGKLIVVLPLEAVITGTVTRAGTPLSDVRVWSQALREGNWAENVTDDQGRYTLQAVQQGTYNVCLDPPEGWTAVAGEGVKCVPGQKIENMDLELIEGGLVTGTVTDAASGQPLAGVGIAAYGPARPLSGAAVQSVKTDEHGQYTFRLPPGENKLYIFSAAYSSDGAGPRHRMVDVIADQTVADIDFRVWASRKVTGTILYPDLQPAPHAYVRVSSHSVAPSHADKDGRFELSVPRSQFPVELTVRVEDRKLVGRAVVSDADEGVRLVLQPQAVITGAIASAQGKGIANVQVKCRYVPVHREGSPFSILKLGAATTDDNGRFELALLPAGVELKLQILGDAGPYMSQTQWPDRLVLQAGETRDIGTATVDMKGRTIRGLVMDADRVLQPDCLVLDITSSAKTRTDEIGSFELTGIPYRPRGSLTNRPYLAHLLAMHPKLPLFAGNAGIDPDWGAEPHLILEPLGKLKGRVLDAHGKPAAQLRVDLQVGRLLLLLVQREHPELHTRGVRLPDSTTTDADGRWSFAGMIGGFEYVVHAYRPGAGRPIFWQEITPEPGQTIDLGDIDNNGPQ